MADGNRVYPVDILVMHHSTGPDFVNASDITVQDWYDLVGKSRGYANVAHSYHYHPSRNKETFAQAQFTGRSYTKDKNKYGHRVTALMKDPFNNVAWGAGNWPINQRAINLENCGNFLSKKLTSKALMCIADWIRPHDKSIGGKLQVLCHKNVSLTGTACPGQICPQCARLIDMINNPVKWANKLWPKPKPPAPKPPTPTIPEWKRNLTPLDEPIKKKIEKAINLTNILTGIAVKSYKVGYEIEVHHETSYKGRRFYMTNYSADREIPNGYIAAEFDYVKPEPPEPTPEPPEPKDPCEQLKKELKDAKTKLETVEQQRDKAIEDLEKYKKGEGLIFVSDLGKAMAKWLFSIWPLNKVKG